MAESRTEKRLKGSIALVVALAICLCATTAAIALSLASVKENKYHTGHIEINLNDNKPVITEDEYLFEPGMTVVKPFFVENKSTWDVYYKLYFSSVSGSLANVLQITILDGDKVLYKGTPADLNRSAVGAADDHLQVNERRNLTMQFYYPKTAGNTTQGGTLSFDFCADAVQTKNNPDKSFS